VPWDILIEQSPRIGIITAEIEETSEGRGRRILGYFMGSFRAEIYTLSVLEVDLQMLDRWVPTMDLETENPPKGFISAKIATQLIHGYLIVSIN